MKLLSELERTDAKLERLQEKRARLDAEINALEEDHEARVLQVLRDAGVTLLPIAVLETLVQKAREAGQGGVSHCGADAQEGVETFVRLSANASPDNEGACERQDCGGTARLAAGQVVSAKLPWRPCASASATASTPLFLKQGRRAGRRLRPPR